jgi:hypothetical protein
MATSNGHFLVEVEGVAAIEASEFDIGGVKHEAFKIMVGNRPNGILGRGKFDVGDCKLKNAYALNGEGKQLFKYFREYTLGITTEKRNIRVIQLDEDGYTAVGIHHFIECVPTEYQPEGKKADSKDAAYFTISFKPTDYEEDFD